MENIFSGRDLQKAIQALEKERLVREVNLKLKFEEVGQSLRPVNILKRSLQGVFHEAGSMSGLLGSALAISAGALSKKIFEGRSPGAVRKTAGQALQLGVTMAVAKKAPALTSAGTSLLKKIFHR
jgi:hypothetical protein